MEPSGSVKNCKEATIQRLAVFLYLALMKLLSFILFYSLSKFYPKNWLTEEIVQNHCLDKRFFFSFLIHKQKMV